MDRLNPNRRCSLCGQYVIADRETLLEDQRFEWDESMVDDFIAGNGHFCVDTDPFGAREWARLADEGVMVPELGWLIADELERRQAAPLANWAVFTGPAASITTAARSRPAMACGHPFSGGPRRVQARMDVSLPLGRPGRPPPRYARAAMACTLSHS
jgi:hypothetical protein